MDATFRRDILDKGLGFPIRFTNIPSSKEGSFPEIKHADHVPDILLALSLKASHLLGSEIKYIRSHFGMSQPDFAKRFSSTHADLVVWERADNATTQMSWAVEKDIRLFVLSKLAVTSEEFLKRYLEFSAEPKGRSTPILLDMSRLNVTPAEPIGPTETGATQSV